jgi:phosphate transport system substrate-binding protein
MSNGSNNVECPNCKTQNSSTAYKCSYCGKNLRGVPPIVLGLATVFLMLGGAYFVFKDKLFIPESPPFKDLASSPTPNATSPTSTDSASSPIPTPTSLVTQSSAPFTTYLSLANVPNVPNGIFNYGGSTTFAPLRSPVIVAAINKAHPQFQLRYTEPPNGKPGSGTGIKMLIEGQMSFAESSRSVKDDEFEQGKNRNFKLEQVAVAIDGIAFYVNPELLDQGLKGISLAQAQDIFTGRVNNWKDVGGPDQEITPFSRNLSAGGTVDYFSEKVLDKKPFGSTVQEVRDTTESIRKVGVTRGGIGYATASEVINQNTIRRLPLSKVTSSGFVSPCIDQVCKAVNKTAFTDGTYPLTRRLFVVIKQDGKLDEQAGVAYTNMLLSDEGQKLVEEAGFVPIR